MFHVLKSMKMHHSKTSVIQFPLSDLIHDENDNHGLLRAEYLANHISIKGVCVSLNSHFKGDDNEVQSG